MKWDIQDHPKYTDWFDSLSKALQDKILIILEILEKEGPSLGRPHADTLEGSKYSNMKELRIQHGGNPCRILFAFDPERQGILLLGGDKTGNSRWYKENIPVADQRYTEHLTQLESRKKQHGYSPRTNGKTTQRKKGKN